jgi:hypothetical protein
VEKPSEAIEGIPGCPENGPEFEVMMICRACFLRGKNIYLIVIVAPPHVSTLYQAFKRLAASLTVDSSLLLEN